jgi:hypothetical protein
MGKVFIITVIGSFASSYLNLQSDYKVRELSD